MPMMAALINSAISMLAPFKMGLIIALEMKPFSFHTLEMFRQSISAASYGQLNRLKAYWQQLQQLQETR